MGLSAGAGSPVFFMCSACRRRKPHFNSPLYRYFEPGEVTLTGRTRPYRAGSHALGVRSDTVSREYKCSCGHVGWSNHRRLATKGG